MPLKEGDSREVKSHNIREMVRAGYPPREAIAASLHKADEYRKKRKR